MRRVTYAGSSFLTTDEVADALFDFIAALDRGSNGESIMLPAVTSDGDVHDVRLLVWPGSELMSVPEGVDALGSDHATLVTELRSRTAQLHAVRQASYGKPSSWSLIDPDD